MGGSGKGRGKSLMITVPDETRAALRARAGKEETTVRALVLGALKNAGYPVPLDELVDRRKAEGQATIAPPEAPPKYRPTRRQLKRPIRPK